ncbi:MAG: peptidylprolyl isomerase [Anaerolineae bacterium]
MARSRTRTKQKRQTSQSKEGVVSITVSTNTVLLAGGGLLALILMVVVGYFIGLRLARPTAPSVAQQQVLPYQNLQTQQQAIQIDTGQPTSTPPAGKATYAAPALMTIDVTKAYTATIKTKTGDIVIRLRPDLAPQHVNNFVFLAREGFYDGLWFHRVIPGFIAQAGDPKGDTTGGPGYLLPHEITDTPHKAGTVAMARLPDPFNPERDSSGSQFYIVLEDSQQATDLDGQYSIFGEVVEGLDVARNLTPRDPSDAYPGDQIKTVEITE